MAKPVLTPRKAVAAKVAAIPQEATATLPSGITLAKGMIFQVTTEPGAFKFMYARNGGAEITCFGGAVVGEKSDHQWRTFRPAVVVNPGANPVALAIVAKAEAEKPAEYAQMTAGQKAAWTKRMKAAAAAPAAMAA